MNMLHLGFDVSTTGAGAVLLDGEGTVLESWCWQSAPGDHVDERIHDIGCWAFQIFDRLSIDPSEAGRITREGVLSCSIEAPFFRGSSSAYLAEAQGAVKAQYRTQWGSYQPTAVKATASRVSGLKTNVADEGKEPMMRAAIAVVDAKVFDGWLDSTEHLSDKLRKQARGDICDAYFVALTDLMACRATRKDSA